MAVKVDGRWLMDAKKRTDQMDEMSFLVLVVVGSDGYDEYNETASLVEAGGGCGAAPDWSLLAEMPTMWSVVVCLRKR
jgi:hypothetical protein